MTDRLRWRGAALAMAVPFTGLATLAPALDTALETEGPTIRVETVADGLVHPWGLAMLPDGGMLVTERPGRLRIVTADGTVSAPVEGLPAIEAGGQGGLLDVALHPDYAENRLVYVSFTRPGEGGNSTAVARGTLDAARATLAAVEVIFSQRPLVANSHHFGSRLVFDGEGHLFVTLGERYAASVRGQAQALDSHLGKIVRLEADGSIPTDNPFAGRADALPEIWSLGHRNVQAAAIDPATGRLWIAEHGPRGGDEINLPEPGGNFGWPLISYGVNYDGTPVGSGEATAPGMIDPIHQWTPVIAASGMMFYQGDAFPEWRGDLFVGGLVAKALIRLEHDGTAILHEERLLEPLGLRIRAVEEGPDGAIYLLTDEEDGALLRISPAEPSP